MTALAWIVVGLLVCVSLPRVTWTGPAIPPSFELQTKNSPATNLTDEGFPTGFRVDLLAVNPSHTIDSDKLALAGIRALATLSVLDFSRAKSSYGTNSEGIGLLVVDGQGPYRQIRGVIWALGGTIMQMIREGWFFDLNGRVFIGNRYIFSSEIRRLDSPAMLQVASSGNSNGSIAREKEVSAKGEEEPGFHLRNLVWQASGPQLNRPALAYVLIGYMSVNLAPNDARRLIFQSTFISMGIMGDFQDVRGTERKPQMQIQNIIWTVNSLAKLYFGNRHTAGVRGDMIYGRMHIGSFNIQTIH